jgi:hypothetical protein
MERNSSLIRSVIFTSSGCEKQDSSTLIAFYQKFADAGKRGTKVSFRGTNENSMCIDEKLVDVKAICFINGNTYFVLFVIRDNK